MKLTLLILANALALIAAPAGNPLLEKQPRIPFDRIRSEHVVPAVTYFLDEAQKKRDAYVANSAPRTFENTLAALEAITEDLDRATGFVNYINNVSTTPDLRKAIDQTLPETSAFHSSMALDSGIYSKVREYSQTPEAKALTGARKRLLELTLKRFRRSGVELSDANKTRLRAISVELARLSKKFADNVLDSTNAFEIVIRDEAKLAGLPESARAAARQSAKQKGVEGWRFTLQEPSYLAVSRFMDDAATREKMYRAYSTRATTGERDNRPLLARILELRRERAKLLGYKNYADLQTEERMAKSGENVRTFLGTLEQKTRGAFDVENKDLAAFRKSLEGPNAPPLAPWDITYYSEKMRKARYDLDEEALKPYFPLPGVLNGMFGLVEKLYGVKIKKIEGVALADPQVQYFEIRDTDGTLLGSFYADLFPREEKRGGAWANPLIVGGAEADGFKPHLGTINGNLTPPVGAQPALLTKRDVETVFHEFGHLMSFVLLNVPVRGLSGVAWDFVELPSQIMENFTWNRECLDLFARHYQSGERIPEELYRKMMLARTYRSANSQMRQLSLGTVDLYLHTDYQGAEKDGDAMDYARKILLRFSPTDLPADYAMIAGFSHIFAGGYAAGYYSYKWAEVLDADAFTRFEKEGIFSRKVGDEFRRKVLEKGNAEDPGDLFRNFMGRDPDPDALLRRNGLLPGRSGLSY